MTSLLLLPLAALLSAGARPVPSPLLPMAQLSTTAHAAGQPSFWREVSASQARRLGKPRFAPTRCRVVALDLAGLKKALAPADATTGPTVPLPLPDGSYRAFQLRASSVMSPELAARYPELRTYAGQAAADYARLEITPTGLHAMLVRGGRTYLIEPYRAGDTQHYICFDKALLPAGSKAAFELPGGPVR